MLIYGNHLNHLFIPMLHEPLARVYTHRISSALNIYGLSTILDNEAQQTNNSFWTQGAYHLIEEADVRMVQGDKS